MCVAGVAVSPLYDAVPSHRICHALTLQITCKYKMVCARPAERADSVRKAFQLPEQCCTRLAYLAHVVFGVRTRTQVGCDWVRCCAARAYTAHKLHNTARRVTRVTRITAGHIITTTILVYP